MRPRVFGRRPLLRYGWSSNHRRPRPRPVCFLYHRAPPFLVTQPPFGRLRSLPRLAVALRALRFRDQRSDGRDCATDHDAE